MEKNMEKVFKTWTRGGANSHARLFVRVVFEHCRDEHFSAVLREEYERLFFLEGKIQGNGKSFYIAFSSRQDFAKFPSIYQETKKRGGNFYLACWDRDWLSYEEREPKNGVKEPEPSDAPDTSPLFWAVVAAAQMYYGSEKN